MKYYYHHTQLLSVSGITLPSGQDELSLLNINDETSSITAILTRYPENYCLNINRKMALILMYLGRGGVGSQNWERLEEEIKLLAEEDKSQFKDKQVIVLNTTGEIAVNIPDICSDWGEFLICHDAVDGEVINYQAIKSINILMSSVYLSSEWHIEFNILTSGSYLQDENGKLIYSLHPTISSTALNTSIVNENFVEKTMEYANKITQSNLYENTIRLIALALNEDNDLLKSFLFAWTALEMFIKQLFDEYEKKDIDKILNANAMILKTEKFKDLNFKKNIKSFNIGQKFIILVFSFCAKTVEQDWDEFIAIKKNRNNLAHEGNGDELPVRKTIILLKKYMRAYYDNMP